MGFFSEVKDAWKEGKEQAIKRQQGESTGDNDYRPSKTYGSAIPAGVYDVFGVDSFDAIFEKTAPHMIKAIYDTRDNLKTNNEYHELLGKYTELEKRYNELQKNYQDLVNSLSKGK